MPPCTPHGETIGSCPRINDGRALREARSTRAAGGLGPTPSVRISSSGDLLVNLMPSRAVVPDASSDASRESGRRFNRAQLDLYGPARLGSVALGWGTRRLDDDAAAPLG